LLSERYLFQPVIFFERASAQAANFDALGKKPVNEILRDLNAGLMT
jgi:hypothetical protein